MATERQEDGGAPGPVRCEAKALFELTWIALVDLLGSAATATLVRRSVKRAALRAPELQSLSITRDRFEYRYELPETWTAAGGESTLDGLRELGRELKVLLVEFTGPVAVHRLRAIPDIERCRMFPTEGE